MKLKFEVTKEGRKQIIIDLNSGEGMYIPRRNALNERDFSMVGDYRYFGIERLNYQRR